MLINLKMSIVRSFCLSLVFGMLACSAAAKKRCTKKVAGPIHFCVKQEICGESVSWELFNVGLSDRKRDLIGTVEFSIPQKKSDVGRIGFLVVEPPYRNRGFGSLLLQAALYGLSQTSCNKVELLACPVDDQEGSEEYTRNLIKLKHLYARFGFESYMDDKPDQLRAYAPFLLNVVPWPKSFVPSGK